MDQHVVNKRKEKHFFGNKEMIEFNRTFWTVDEGHFIHPRNKSSNPPPNVGLPLDWGKNWQFLSL